MALNQMLVKDVRPKMSISDLNCLLISEYKLKILEFTELNSHEDRNFHAICQKVKICDRNVTTDKEDAGSHDRGNCLCRFSTESFSSPEFSVATNCDYLIKIMKDDSSDFIHMTDCRDISKSERIQIQMKIVSQLLHLGFVCPEVVPSLSGTFLQELTMTVEDEPVRYLVYLTKYIRGRTLLDFTPLSSQMMNEVGSLLAQLHCSLKDVVISYDGLLSSSPWSLENANEIKAFLPKAELDDWQMALASDVLDYFSHNVLCELHDLPHGIIHGDFHDENILVLEGKESLCIFPESNSEPVYVTSPSRDCLRAKYAVIDFGDVSFSPYVFDLAIAVAYFMICYSQPDFVEHAGHFLSSYFKLYKPTAKEIRSLYASICASYCRETVLAKYSYLEQLESNEYLLTAVDVGWKQLKHLWNMGQDDVMSIWQQCELNLDF